MKVPSWLARHTVPVDVDVERRQLHRMRVRLAFVAFLFLVVMNFYGLFKLGGLIAEVQTNRVEAATLACRANNVQNTAITAILNASLARRPQAVLPREIEAAIVALRPVPNCKGYAERLIKP